MAQFLLNHNPQVCRDYYWANFFFCKFHLTLSLAVQVACHLYYKLVTHTASNNSCSRELDEATSKVRKIKKNSSWQQAESGLLFYILCNGFGDLWTLFSLTVKGSLVLQYLSASQRLSPHISPLATLRQMSSNGTSCSALERKQVMTEFWVQDIEILRLEFTQLPKWSRCLNQDSIKRHFPGNESPPCLCPPLPSLPLRLPVSCCCPPEHVSQ